MIELNLLRATADYGCEDCKVLHGLRDAKCTVQTNAIGEKIGKICKKKCSAGEEYKCRGNQLSKLQCNTKIGVCESIEPNKPSTSRPILKITERCGKRIKPIYLLMEIMKIFIVVFHILITKFLVFILFQFLIPHKIQ